MLYKESIIPSTGFKQAIAQNYFKSEKVCVDTLLDAYPCSVEQEARIRRLAEELMRHVQDRDADSSGMQAFMQHYDLSSEEGVLMMCLAEALLRIPDAETEDLLINDKLTSANWYQHIGLSHSSFVNVSTWGLALTGKILKQNDSNVFLKLWKNMIKRSGEPIIRAAVRAAIQLLSQHFVLGKSIGEAVKRSQKTTTAHYSYSYDMLGEAAITQGAADYYYAKYLDAIRVVGASANHKIHIQQRSGVSIKLSALHPRYQWAQRDRSVPTLVKLLVNLSLEAKKFGIPLTVDAEESDRLEISLEIFEQVFLNPLLKDWHGLGLAVQAYQKRASAVIEWLAELAGRGNKTIAVRLVKGAYWDTEIKQAQLKGLEDYPVFTRKSTTDLSYLNCANEMLKASPMIYPQFATHNAYTAASIVILANDLDVSSFEFQALQGMGQSLHDYLIDKKITTQSCRIYAPVGVHEDLLPYLVRRLLENGANSSFVNQIIRSEQDFDRMLEPLNEQVSRYKGAPLHPQIPSPADIFYHRRNSSGWEWSDSIETARLQSELEQWADYRWNRNVSKKLSRSVINPSNQDDHVGCVSDASIENAVSAIDHAKEAFSTWSKRSFQERAVYLQKIADLLEGHRAELLALLVREAGKTFVDGLAELREAIDFCRYYAQQACDALTPQVLMGYTGEANTLSFRGRGVMVCVSPWNFPLAIFLGQIVACLVTGNTVIAKPAEQTSLIALRVADLIHQAGVPDDVLNVVLGEGSTIGSALIQHSDIAGVLFTGSTATAKSIQRMLAHKDGPIVPFIAETGGLNAMLVDSTALPEQTINDVILSAFGSAGQRCSACRILLLQSDIADEFIEMLQGAMAELIIGDPQWLKTDIGPVIDQAARDRLLSHEQYLSEQGCLIYKLPLGDFCSSGLFVAPLAYEIADLSLLKEEVFGPILHVIRFERKNRLSIIKQLNQLGYGLTFGMQSRIESSVSEVLSEINAGNLYVNRNTIGAVVGLQPFGGVGLSGTGPKAGGPNYLQSLCHEVTVSIDTTAAGGNASLMAMEE